MRRQHEDRHRKAPRRSVLMGGADDDVVTGSPNDDKIVSGNAGDDLVGGGNGNNGDDDVYGGTGHDLVKGGDGQDVVMGDAGRDEASGGAGHDVVHTGEGRDDFAYGDDGDDEVVVQAVGGAGHGGPGNDMLDTDARGVLLAGDDGDDELTGGSFADRLEGDAGNDSVSGQGEADTINGGSGDDTLYEDLGDDVIDAGDGTDTCTGGTGTDSCDGGSPGLPENSPDDPDVFDAETTVSCQAVGIPDGFVGTIEGYEIQASRGATGTWSMQPRFEKVRRSGHLVTYKLVAGTFSYDMRGDNGACTWSQTGSIDADGYIEVDIVRNLYDFYVGSDALPHSTWHCPGGTSEHAESWRPGNAVTGRVWDPEPKTSSATWCTRTRTGRRTRSAGSSRRSPTEGRR